MDIADYLLLRRRVVSRVHGTDASDKTQTDNSPRVRGHQTVRPSVHVHRSSRNTDDTNAQTGVQERLVEVAALIWRHAAILSRLTVEDQVRRQNGTTHNGSSVQQPLGQGTLVDPVGRLHIRAAEGILEGLLRAAEDGRRRTLEGSVVVEEPSGSVGDGGVRGFGRDLLEHRRNGEGPSEHESHGCKRALLNDA